MVSHSARSLAYCRVIKGPLLIHVQGRGMDRTLHLVGGDIVDCLACLLRDFEANGPPRFALPNGCSIERIPMRRHVSDFHADNITSSKFAVDGQVKQRNP